MSRIKFDGHLVIQVNSVSLWHRGDKFFVIYNNVVHGPLTKGQAAVELGQCIIHENFKPSAYSQPSAKPDRGSAKQGAPGNAPAGAGAIPAEG